MYVCMYIQLGIFEELDSQNAQRSIAEAKFVKVCHRMGDHGWYLELLRASESTLTYWSWLHLQSLALTSVSRRVGVRQAAGRKNNCRIFIIT
jgi:hypothetical protein